MRVETKYESVIQWLLPNVILPIASARENFPLRLILQLVFLYMAYFLVHSLANWLYLSLRIAHQQIRDFFSTINSFNGTSGWKNVMNTVNRWDPDIEIIAESDPKQCTKTDEKQCPCRYKQRFGSALVSMRIRIQHFNLHVFYHQKRNT